MSTANGFIDLATFSDLEGYMYGGPLAISWFVAGVQKANWFTIVPIQLRNNGTFGFGAEGVSATLNRSGDYVLNVWFRCQIPTLAPITAGASGSKANVRWTRNLMHNLISKVTLTFNELTVQEFDNYWLDFNSMFNMPPGKAVAYRNMIGDVSRLTTSWDPEANVASVVGGTKRGLLGGYFSCIIPFWFSSDSGVSLPIASLPFNDVKITYVLRKAEDLLVMTGGATISNIASLDPSIDSNTGLNVNTVWAQGAPDFKNGYTHAHYAVVHNDERSEMGVEARDILIRQIQTVGPTDVSASANEVTFDVRLSHSIVAFFFALRNKTQKGEWSNYTTNIDYLVAGGQAAAQGGVGAPTSWDPIESTQLVYENTTRLHANSDFFSLIHPFFFSTSAPSETGYHMWSYALKPWDVLSPSGSSNHSKLANVQVRHTLSPIARYYLANNLATASGGAGGLSKKLELSNIFVGCNWNIVRISNGSLGHPTM